MSFSDRLNQLVNESNQTLSAIAAGIGITLRGLEYLLNGRSGPRVYVLCATAEFFKVTTDYLLGRTGDRR